MINEVFNFFLIASVFIGFIFIFKTFFSKKGSDKSIIYLNLVVVFLTLNYLQIVIIDNIYTNVDYFVTMLRLPFYVLILPAFYTFVTYYLNVERKIKSFAIISISLFAVEIIFRIILYNLKSNHYLIAQYRQIEEIINIIFSLFIFLKAFLLLFTRENLYQSILKFDNLKWLKKFIIIATIIMLNWLIAVIFNLDKVENPPMFIYYPLRFSIFILIFWLSYYGFFNYSLLSERIVIRKELYKNRGNIKISERSNRSNFKNKKFNIIKDHIESKFDYLNPEFSLEKLSLDINMSTSSLSHIINEESGYNFSDYINSLRVEKAKELLVLDDFKDYTILSIGLECGFNSKSTFYLAFKKFTNLTPTEFRNQ
jgi:AraC-like DNA-binding protein